MQQPPRPLPFLFALAASALAAQAFGQQIVREGSEFQVNSYTTNSQAYSSVAADADGDFVVVWKSTAQGGTYAGIFGQRFSSSGLALASEFQVNSYTTGRLYALKVAADADGDFVVVWSGASPYGVFGRRFSSAGAALGTELQVTSPTASISDPGVAAEANGDFVVTWVDYGQDGDSAGIFARRFSSAGVALAGEFQVNAYTLYEQRFPAVAADADGDFLIVWTASANADGAANGVFGRRFSSAGATIGADFQVNAYTPDFQSQPAVDMGLDGSFVVAWDSFHQDGSEYGVFARRFSNAGVPLAVEFQVNTYTTESQRYPSVALNGAGAFVVSWASVLQDGSFFGVFARRFSSTGVAVASELQVNTYTAGQQREPTVASSNRASFVVSWNGYDQDGSMSGVFAQRFSVPIILDIDGDGAVQPLTDLLLGLRYAFGFRGATLINGVVGAGCTRCDAPAIEAYLMDLTN